MTACTHADEYPPLSPEDQALFVGILREARPPVAEAFAAGQAAHRAGKAFHEGPRPLGTPNALSWRLGWNDEALKVPSTA